MTSRHFGRLETNQIERSFPSLQHSCPNTAGLKRTTDNIISFYKVLRSSKCVDHHHVFGGSDPPTLRKPAVCPVIIWWGSFPTEKRKKKTLSPIFEFRLLRVQTLLSKFSSWDSVLLIVIMSKKSYNEYRSHRIFIFFKNFQMCFFHIYTNKIVRPHY